MRFVPDKVDVDEVENLLHLVCGQVLRELLNDSVGGHRNPH